MTVDTRETPERPTPSIGGRLADAARHAAHLSHEARMVRSMAEDAIEDGVHRATRAVKSVRRGIEHLEDAKDDAVYFVKHRPLKTVGVAAGIGLAVGVMAGWIAGRGRARRGDTELS